MTFFLAGIGSGLLQLRHILGDFGGHVVWLQALLAKKAAINKNFIPALDKSGALIMYKVTIVPCRSVSL
jgi:hypothetical protein